MLEIFMIFLTLGFIVNRGISVHENLSPELPTYKLCSPREIFETNWKIKHLKVGSP